MPSSLNNLRGPADGTAASPYSLHWAPTASSTHLSQADQVMVYQVVVREKSTAQQETLKHQRQQMIAGNGTC